MKMTHVAVKLNHFPSSSVDGIKYALLIINNIKTTE